MDNTRRVYIGADPQVNLRFRRLCCFIKIFCLCSMMSSENREGEGDKPFSCPVPGCKKRYKNINGIKYHAKHGHKDEVRFVSDPREVSLCLRLKNPGYESRSNASAVKATALRQGCATTAWRTTRQPK
jgi:hypothetical protein